MIYLSINEFASGDKEQNAVAEKGKKKKKTKRSPAIRIRSAAWNTRRDPATLSCAIARAFARAWYACAWVGCRCACTPLGRADRHISRENVHNNDCARLSRSYRTTSTASSRRCYSVSQISVISANFSALQHNNRNHSVSKAPRISPFFPRTACHRSISGSVLFARFSFSLSLFLFPAKFFPLMSKIRLTILSDWNRHHYSFYLIHLPWRVASAYKEPMRDNLGEKPDCAYDVDKHDVWFVVRSNYVFERWKIKGHWNNRRLANRKFQMLKNSNTLKISEKNHKTIFRSSKPSNI